MYVAIPNNSLNCSLQAVVTDSLLMCSPKASSALFFKYNAQLGPPYYVLLDTNFINFSIQNKLEIVSAMMDCLFAKCTLTTFSSASSSM